MSVIERFLAIVGMIGAAIACFAVMANDIYYFGHHGLTPSVILFFSAFLLGFLPRLWGLALVIAVIPLTAGIPSLVNAIWGVAVLAMPNPGVDLVAGLAVSYGLQCIYRGTLKKLNDEKRFLSFLGVCPWPVGLALLMIAASTLLAIVRNLYLSATTTSLKGLLFNLMHFRPMDWRADYLPLGNWVAYAIAASLVIMVVGALRALPQEQRNHWIFRPLIIGLAISAVIGLIQAATGLGLPTSQLEFRKDAFGYAALGMQPDLHAYAAHMLLGVVGLWGYFLVCRDKLEKAFIIVVFILCSAGLVASKSRASLVIAVLALLILSLIYLYQYARKTFWIIAPAVAIFVVILGWFIQSGALIEAPRLGWVGDLISQMRHRRLDNLSDLGGMMGSRFEIWGAVANMFSAFPLMGVGEGEFYRLSSNISFAKSEFLQLNHGENAHNYFFQVLAENGLIGIGIFALVFILPYRAIYEKRLAIPAVVGIISLFLGNLFAHSFLVRENLLLCAVLLGLLYAVASDAQSEAKAPAKKLPASIALPRLTVISISICLLLGAIWEVYSAFGRIPFKAGADCFIKELPLYSDGWASGAWGERLPKGATEVELTLAPHRPHIDKRPLTVRAYLYSWEAGKGNVPITTASHQWVADEAATIKLILPKTYYNSPNLITVNLVTSNCYTPRNLGINTDGRRLGVEIMSRQFH